MWVSRLICGSSLVIFTNYIYKQVKCENLKKIENKWIKNNFKLKNLFI